MSNGFIPNVDIEVNPLSLTVPTQREKEVEMTATALLEKGGKFRGNRWTNKPGKGGYYEIRIEVKGVILILESPRPFFPKSL